MDKDLDHMNDRLDQHDDRTKNITSRIRDLEAAVGRSTSITSGSTHDTNSGSE